VVLEFPDTASEMEAASFTVAALPMSADCTAMMTTGVFTSPIEVVMGALPLSSPAHLGVVPRGQAIFFAEVRDAVGRPFLRACQLSGSGGEVVLPLQRVNRLPEFSAPPTALQVDEGQVLSVDVAAVDPDGTTLTFAARALPDFGAFDPQTRKLTFTPGFTDSGQYTLMLDATEDGPGGATVTRTVTLTVNDMPRPLAWNRLYRGWHGRFDAAALWDPVQHQLLTTGGRDVGIDLALPTLYTQSSAPDVLADFHSLDFTSTPAGWNRNPFSHTSSAGKYGHVMGFVTDDDTSERMGFVLGGSDGSQVSPEVLLLEFFGKTTTTTAPGAVNGNTYFLTGMAAAIEPPETCDAGACGTYLFGGDLGFSDFHNQMLKVTSASSNLTVAEVQVPPLGRPAPRTQATMVMALNPRRLVVIGGRTLQGAFEVQLNDAWVLCLEAMPPKCPAAATWYQVQPTGDAFPGSSAPGVFGLVAGYDAANDRVITYGGLGVVANKAWLFDDAFSLDLSASTVVDAGFVSGAWTKLPNPETANGPYGLVGAASAYDSAAGRLLLYGGLTGRFVNGNAQLDITEDVWQLGLTPGNEKLTKIAANGIAPYPARRISPSLTARGDPLLFGGEGEGSEPTDTWLIHPSSIESTSIAGNNPLPRAQFDVVWNPDLGEHWCYGGRVGNLRPVAALWRLQPDAGFVEMDQSLDTDPRFGQATVYDSVNHDLVLFGGIAGPGALNDVERLTVSGNTVLTTQLMTDAGIGPDPRYGMVSGYDRWGQRLIIFGGTKMVSGSEIDTNEVWQLSLVPGQERWSQITTSGLAPPPMYLPGGVLTKENPPVLYVVGTINRPPITSPMFIDNIYKLTLTPGQEHWSPVTLPDFRPRPRLFPTVIYDELQHRLLLAGGAQDPVFRNDVWALTLP
jgi:hypothetical protein